VPLNVGLGRHSKLQYCIVLYCIVRIMPHKFRKGTLLGPVLGKRGQWVGSSENNCWM